MKCPKCGYLGFEDVDRCRNCGYEFSLTAEPPLQDLPIRSGNPTPNPLDDLSFVDAAAAPDSPRMTDIPADMDRAFGAPEPRAPAAPLVERRVARGDLPLFRRSLPDDEPLITAASPPRPPLAVRRSTPEVPRARAQAPRLAPLDFASEADPDLRARADPAGAKTDADLPPDAGVAARFVAAVLDLAILAAIDAAVVYFTMQICGLTAADLGILPKGPLIAFLLLQNGGYLVAFTAGGQTLGKMAAGIRVVSNESAGPLDVGHALLRTAVWVLLAAPAGLGFVSAILSRDRRGLHDRFAGTRVVRAA